MVLKPARSRKDPRISWVVPGSLVQVLVQKKQRGAGKHTKLLSFNWFRPALEFYDSVQWVASGADFPQMLSVAIRWALGKLS